LGNAARAGAGPGFSAHSAENLTPSYGGAAWYYLQSSSLAHNGKYTRLGDYNPAFLGMKGSPWPVSPGWARPSQQAMG
jgi:hypothetical protein